MKRRPYPATLTAVATAALLALGNLAAHAQVSTSTLKGQVGATGTAARAGVPVTAVNRDNGNTYRTETRTDGSYVLAGLAPGRYLVRVGAEGTEGGQVELQVGETASLDLALAAAAGTGGAERVTIVGSAQRQGVKESQVGTTISRKLIEATPQSTRNFLAAADMAPGVRFVEEASGNTRIQSGAQNIDNVNVFIDGVSQKNNILRGGISGQDSSRGNPFPQSAIAEYKVLTQNYKAEFDQVSGAAITAITKSGGNETHGEIYADRTGTNWRAKSPFEKERRAQGVKLPPSSKNEFGASVGGAIKEDVLHYFVAYDGKRINDSRQVTPRRLDLLPADAGIVPSLREAQGSAVDRFTEHLFFGKLDAQLSDNRRLSLSTKIRRENDTVPEDRDLSAPGNSKDRVNDETRVDLVHEWNLGAWLSETRVGYENTVYNPRSSSHRPFIKYTASTSALQSLDSSQDVLFVGGSSDAQHREQTGLTLAQDLTYTGVAGHVFKMGARFKDMRYSLSGTSRSVDIVRTLIDSTTGEPYFDGSNCLDRNGAVTGDNDTSALGKMCHIDRALAGASARFNNQQFGLYFQDDWSVTKKLELNLGVRYDYETNMLNNRYVTPADRVAALYSLDTTRSDITPEPGQTYAESLAKGGIHIADYIADGKSRRKFKGAFAPRLGSSYDVFGDKATVIFGGWGRSYDRTMANNALDEKQKNAVANGETWLIRNKGRMPYADQWSLGLRQALGAWNTEAILSSVRAKNQFMWFRGNRDPNGGYGSASTIDPLWGGAPGYGNLVLGDFVGENKTNSLFLKAERPYTRDAGWGFALAYTYTDASTTNKEWSSNLLYDWTYGRSGRGWNPSTDVDKHRIVAAGVWDGLPWGLQFSAKASWASGLPRKLTDCTGVDAKCVYREADSPSFRQVDVSLLKNFKLGSNTAVLRADVLNLFNTANYGGFDDWIGRAPAAGNPANRYGGDNLNVGKPNGMRGPMRTVKVTLAYRF
ncbi:TonB-dependent receptor [Aquincola sp. MAHUQ-54]|uniref:TonB-dependent receptor n=1 Tax=Aquincola agrisoli TaxID=3119538 RepID=A0AAW9QGE6_9BURK